ncbi:MAG: hypothetical protein M3Y70_01085 [Pseudomonadota bacterium]|nr:hypothetical protein [Pseudomonadota bacterium]
MKTTAMTRSVLAAAMLAALIGCERDATAPPAKPAMGAVAAETAVTPVVPESSVPDAIVVSTNEPFWQGWVEGGQLALAGAGVDERRYDIESSALENGERVVRASSDAGSVELHVADVACEDSMSGAAFPYSGTLAIDGGEPVRGCARPAIPAHFHGRWAPDAAGCADADATIEDIEVDGRALRFHESVAFPVQVRIVDGNSVRLANRYSGEGEQWTSEQTLAVSGDTLVITGPDDLRLERVRCREPA